MSRVLDGKRFANRKFYQHDFRETPDLMKSDFRGVTAHDCNFDGCDLSYANFEGANLFGSSFMGSKVYQTDFTDAILAQTKFFPRELFGVKLSMVCASFEGMKVSDGAFLSIINFTLMLEPESPELKSRLQELLGEENLEKIRRLCTK